MPICKRSSTIGSRALHRNDTIQHTGVYVKLVGLIWQFPPPDRINIWDSIQLSKIYAPRRDQDTTLIHQPNTPLPPPKKKVLIIQLQIDREHFLISISSTASKPEAVQQHVRLSSFAFCEKHIHIKTQPPAIHLQIETITERHFYEGTVCEESLVIIQVACMTRGSYYNTVYIYT